VLSFISPWIVPASVLDKSALSLNFHPGSCDYPGIGCYNFALYEEARQFGPVCHHMLPKVDSGTVVKEILFPVLPQDRVETLKLRTMVAMLALFHEMLGLIATGQTLPVSSRQWTRKPFTRRQLDALGEITPGMSKDEENRRIRAMAYPGFPGAYRLEGTEKHYYPIPPGPAIA
jgi:methionyl-tRNA formyltransferase